MDDLQMKKKIEQTGNVSQKVPGFLERWRAELRNYKTIVTSSPAYFHIIFFFDILKQTGLRKM